MAKKLTITLTDKQYNELDTAVKKNPKPYVRERASAILKIAAGASGRATAFRGLLQPRRKDTVYDWFHNYEQDGLSGLYNKPGRGRKPSFSPAIHHYGFGS